MVQMLLKDNEFTLFQQMMYDKTGIALSAAKKALVCGRLAKRLRHYELASYEEYFQLLFSAHGDELGTAIDLLTTNETYFFREPRHFDYLIDHIIPNWSGGYRKIWSAACSSGEEAYTLAMVMATHARQSEWDIVGTDVSGKVLQVAQKGLYRKEHADKIPREYLSRHCLKGTGALQQWFTFEDGIRDRVRFKHANLMEDQRKLGSFDLIFLRNVLIYFDLDTKRQVVSRLLKQLKSGGYLVVGHAESLHGLTPRLKTVEPSVYRLERK